MSEIDPDALAPPGDRRVTWGPGLAISGFFAALFCAVILGLPSDWLDTSPPGGDLSTGAAIYAQSAQVIAFILVPLIVAMHGGGGIGRGLWRLGVRRPDTNPLGWMALVVVGYIGFLIAYGAVVTPPEQEDIASLFGPVWVQVLLIVFGAAISEELLFRGMLYGGFRQGMPSWIAILLAGTVFGLLHLPTGASAVPPLIVFGALLCLLYEETGSIIPGLLLHALNNAAALHIQ